MIFYDVAVNSEYVPYISRSVIIHQNLTYNVFPLHSPADNVTISSWSGLRNLLSYVIRESSIAEKEAEKEHWITNIQNSFKNLIPLGHTEVIEKKLSFLEEQFNLVFTFRTVGFCYSTNMVLFAFMIHTQSPGCYKALRNTEFLTIPHEKYLKRISSGFHVGADSEGESMNFLKTMRGQLTDREAFVVLELDEIYLNGKMEYKSKSLIGAAENNTSYNAKTAQVFLINSIFGHFEQVVRIHPIINLDGPLFFTLTVAVVQLIQSCGFHILCMQSDNNRANRNMFDRMITDFGVPHDCKFVIQLPNSQYLTFLTFDPVHILKCIRNNWLNQNDVEKSFVIRPFNDLTGDCLTASFLDIRTLYHHESKQLLKLAFRLNRQSVYPSKLERQKVVLAVNIFHESTRVAVKSMLESGVTKHSGTFEFLEIISHWWDIVNVKDQFAGIRTRNEFMKPFFRNKSESDFRFQFLQDFLLWLDSWRPFPSRTTSTLTIETYSALHQCTSVLLYIIKYSFDVLNVDYVLTGKLQTDNIEKRFSMYRQLGGGMYLSKNEKSIFSTNNT